MFESYIYSLHWSPQLDTSSILASLPYDLSIEPNSVHVKVCASKKLIEVFENINYYTDQVADTQLENEMLARYSGREALES